MRPRIQQSALVLLAVFAVGGLLLPFAHELTHIRSLEHRHGGAAADFSYRAVGQDRSAPIDFIVEERTVPHNPDCTLCARLTLDAPVLEHRVEPYLVRTPAAPHVERGRSSLSSLLSHIRAPPFSV